MHEQEEAGDDLLKKVIPRRKKERKEGDSEKRKRRGWRNRRREGSLGLRGLVGKRHSLAGCLRGRIAVRFLAHLAGESYFEVRLLCILG